MAIELTEEQKELKRQVIHWYNNFPSGKPYFYYSGAAGTGKTTVMKSIIDDLGLRRNEYIACAYVGKAVLVLLRNGLPATTIHHLIYYPATEIVREVEFDEWGNPHKTKKKKTGFFLKKELPRDLKLIFVDECAMVTDKMRREIQSFGIPIVMAGDCNQLPPVMGSSSILDSPDFELHQIMRQEEGNPIVYLSQCILNNTPIQLGDYGLSKVVSEYTINEDMLNNYDMIITPTNEVRDMINREMRLNVLGRKDDIPVIGDKVICRHNDWDETLDDIALTNGLVGYLTDTNYCSLHRDIIYVDFRPDFMDESFRKLTLDYAYMKLPYKDRKDYDWMTGPKQELFEYAYAITVHLSQGSEYNRVMFLDGPFGGNEKERRMKYTAVTRAKEVLTWVKYDNPRKKYFGYNGALFQLPT